MLTSHDTELTSKLHEERLETVLHELVLSGARSVLDLGCGTGELLIRLLRHGQFERIVGVDTSPEALASARERLRSEPGAERVSLIRGSYTARDERLRGFDAAALVETIEHVEPNRLSAVERTLFGFCRPSTVLITTPNRDYNSLHGISGEGRRHEDHKFEWSREKFERWATGVAIRNGYVAEFSGIGWPHPTLGSSSQVGKFSLVQN